MKFRLFGIPVRVQFVFWVTALLFGFVSLPVKDGSSEPAKELLAVWIAIVFVSVLVHELGHALAVRRHGLAPEIELSALGGVTRWQPSATLGRLDRVLISLAGPFAGFGIAALLWAFERVMPSTLAGLPDLVKAGLSLALLVNVSWGIINLLPVLPFDGGHVLEHALGPERVRISAGISFAVGVLVTLYFLHGEQLYGALLFGMGAMRSLQRLRGGEPAAPGTPPSPEAAAKLARARAALDDERNAEAAKLAGELLSAPGNTPELAASALAVLAWAALGMNNVPTALEAHRVAQSLGPTDPALTAAVLRAADHIDEAREVYETARAQGDTRTCIVGPLVQILIQQGEIDRAAAVAFDVLPTLSDDDARTMVHLAFDRRAFGWSARLAEGLFSRTERADDAFDAARSLAMDGAVEQARSMLERALAAGLDPARSSADPALATLVSAGT